MSTCNGCGRRVESNALPRGWVRLTYWLGSKFTHAGYCSLPCAQQGVRDAMSPAPATEYVAEPVKCPFPGCDREGLPT